MQYATLFGALCAAGLAAAVPLQDRDVVYDYVYDTVVVTVTDEVPAVTQAPVPAYTPPPPPPARIPVSSVVVSPTPPASPKSDANTGATANTGSTGATANTGSTGATANTGSTAQSSTGGLAAPTDFVSTALYHHNIHRANHSVSDMTYNDTLAGYAATVAAKCVFAHDQTEGGGGYGQNIASFGETGDVEGLGAEAMLAGAVTDMWYNGELGLFLPSFYGEANPDMTDFDNWGHFSQLVWKDSTEVGCATQYCPAGGLFPTFAGWYTVCNYGPPGNMGGEYGDNILEPLGHPSISA